jgi:hypothetical protein
MQNLVPGKLNPSTRYIFLAVLAAASIAKSTRIAEPGKCFQTYSPDMGAEVALRDCLVTSGTE